MKWVELLIATALFVTLFFFGRYLLADFHSGIARGRFQVFSKQQQPIRFWLMTAVTLLFYSLVFVAALAGLIGACSQFLN